ncbi:MAG: tetratricopeptide repeat protein [Thiolinea sp.]
MNIFFQYIFTDANTKNNSYAGGFFAHLTFTLEFTSLIFGLIHFINISGKFSEVKNLTNDEADKKILNQLETNKVISPSSGRLYGLYLLRLALRIFTKYNPDKRLFICLSGLEKIVDKRGNAYSPVHREFFRILTDTSYKEKISPSIDLLLIAEKTKYPIRYLSEEIQEPLPSSPREDYFNEVKEISKKDYIYRKDIHSWIKKWNTLENWSLDEKKEEELFENICEKIKELSKKHSYLNKIIKNKNIKPIRKINNLDLEIAQEVKNIVNSKNINAYIYYSLITLMEDNEVNYFNHEILYNQVKYGEYGLVKISLEKFRYLYIRIIKDEIPKKSNSHIKNNYYKIPAINVLDVIIRHLALFSYPIQGTVLLICPEISRRLEYDLYGEPRKSQSQTDKENQLKVALDILSAFSIIIKIRPLGTPFKEVENPRKSDNKDKSECSLNHRYILHRSIAKIIGQDMSYINQYSPESAPYRTTLYCEQLLSKGRPTKELYDFLSNILKVIIGNNNDNFPVEEESILDNIKLNEKIDHPNFKEEFYQNSAAIRAAYAVLRGSFSISSVSRMDGTENIYETPPYETYRSWIREIIYAATRLSKYKSHYQANQKKSIKNNNVELRLPFYRDEVAWLYNERGLVSFIQGRLFDAIPLYKQALRTITGSNEGVTDQSFRAPYRRIQINLALAELERGNIQRAKDILDEIINAIFINYHSTRSTTLMYAKGYRALCDHLTGNFAHAEEEYLSVIEESSKISHLRAVSIFQRHLADLKRIEDKKDEAGSWLLLSEKSAAQARQEDILHYSLLARARLMRDMKERREALEILRRAESYALSMGLEKMTAEALKVRGEIMLSEGEVTQAGFVTAQSVALSKRNGMRLRKIAATLIQAQVYKTRGQVDAALQILDEIVLEADKLSYTLKSSAAQQLRQQLRVS